MGIVVKKDKQGNSFSDVVSPKGHCMWAKVFEPETKFNPEGDYSIQVNFDPKTVGVKELMEAIDAYMDEAEQLALAEAKTPKARQKIKRNDFNYGEEYDKDGETPTGNLFIRCKMKASGTSKDGKKWVAAPKVFDAKGMPIKKDDNILIGNNSTVKVAFTMRPYNSPLGYGVVMHLNAVQVLELVAYMGSKAADYGFESEEGYEKGTVSEEMASGEENVASYRETNPNLSKAAELNGDFS